MPRLLSGAEVDRFQQDGFLSFDPAVPDVELRQIRETLMALHENNVGFAEGALFDAISADDGGGPQRFPQILHPRVFAPHLKDTQFFRAAASVARQLLGEKVRFKADLSLLKPARIGAATPWHQDEAFQDPRNDYQEVSFWLALQPTNESNSCMAYIPGSHRAPVLPHGFPGNDPRVHALECVGSFDPAHAVACHLPTGGCVIHNQRTLHYAGPNVSDEPRLAYVLIFDLVPQPAREPRTFPWRSAHNTARARRERTWRRHGGLVIHMWRQRSRLRLTSVRHLIFDLRRAISAVRRARQLE